MRIGIISGILLFVTIAATSQDIKSDSLSNLNPEVTGDNPNIEQIDTYASRFDPRKAMLYAAVFPGAGQFYNKKYWKMPLVYGGFAVIVTVVDFYATNHTRFRNELFIKLTDPAGGTTTLTVAQLRRIVDRTRRDRDFFIAIGGFFYLLQMVDAHVDAHLKEFDLNPKLQVRIEPMMDNNPMIGRNTGIALRLRF